MSNNTLVENMRTVISDCRSGRVSLRDAAAKLNEKSNALDTMPYELVQSLDNLAMQLREAAIDQEDGFQSNSGAILERFEMELEKVPVAK